MGIFSRIRDAIFGRTRNVDFGDDRLNDIWHELEGEVKRSERQEFIDAAADTFETAYVDESVDSEERVNARAEFEGLCSTYEIDIADFDWDAWRDWYNGAA